MTNQFTIGSLRLFRLFGISVFVHWSWFVVAVFMMLHMNEQSNIPVEHRMLPPGLAWSAICYLSIFAIVLIHEFGHALACRSVGGLADTIVLWPLGGIAFVRPPDRPGAVLWSIAAGPLVNVILVPVTVAFFWWAQAPENGVSENIYLYARFLLVVNGLLLVFNMLPIYPLDGGQILQSLLWFIVGRSRSLLIVAVFGLIIGVLVAGASFIAGETWYMVMGLFVAWRSWEGFRTARWLARVEAHQKAQDEAIVHKYATQPWDVRGGR